ncbi:unnamed protein product [Adineta steineri]|uniref:Uncharacterized protein n=1 Tax=Adineta steineri TaxID=433720 RepID=A0A815Y1D2_9BILA|nr:unnamed protein product [Adineta steineri]CAF1564378.1 unnamed protein product [Adineta steineri]
MRCPVIFFDPCGNTICVMHVQANQQTKQVDMGRITYPHSCIPLEQQLDLLTQAPIHQDITQLFCDIVEEVEAGIPFPNIYNGIRHTKVAILVIDGSIVLGDNLETIANEFKRRDIVLIVNATASSSYDIQDFYRELAYKTGGEYMLTKDVRNMRLPITDPFILRVDADLQMYLGNMVTNTSVTDDTDDQNEIIDGVGDLPFDHGLC